MAELIEEAGDLRCEIVRIADAQLSCDRLRQSPEIVRFRFKTHENGRRNRVELVSIPGTGFKNKPVAIQLAPMQSDTPTQSPLAACRHEITT